ncbi:hypothetical protein C8F04DRAFT_1240126 [Mycena alexandri]|uniref:Uncharacterized protein n=1 Tax=Mycena alexandri TaxID=1745969 RepID=A0AAD6S929_9AGAR|nr:hypothetical protein C8F04DRAFT_1197801 [Mycena alexandri]KAJ7023494.1 hypothetical protein C8F04DRAFT_1240126 [Mycena alexandri]
MDPFASDTVVDCASVLEILRHHLLVAPASSPGIYSHSQLTAALLFELCSVLAPNAQVSTQRILPRVLSTSRHWRLLPEDERVSSRALEELAKKLAKLAIPAPPFSRAMIPLIWISSLHDHPWTTSRGTRTSVRRAIANASCVPKVVRADADAENTAPTLPIPIHADSKTESDDAQHNTNARTSVTSVALSPEHPHLSATQTTTNTNASPLSFSPLLVNGSIANAKPRSAPALAVTPFVSSHHLTPRPWRLPQPGTVVLRKPKPSSAAATASTPPRVVLGPKNALD